VAESPAKENIAVIVFNFPHEKVARLHASRPKPLHFAILIASKYAQMLVLVLDDAIAVTCDFFQPFAIENGEFPTRVANHARSLQSITVLTRYCSDRSVRGDVGLLRQMFSNLLINVADAMPNGGRMQMRCTTCHEWNDDERHGMRVTFADNGCGIATNHFSLVMESFFQGSSHGDSCKGV
jgi:signal transduction histidine kinase